VRAPWCSSGPPSYSSSSSHLLIRTEALHPTLLHRLPPYVACKAARNCLSSASRIARHFDPHPYSSLLLTIFIYTFFIISIAFYLAFIYSVFMYYVFLSEFVTYLFILFLVLDDTAFTVRWLLFCIFNFRNIK